MTTNGQDQLAAFRLLEQLVLTSPVRYSAILLQRLFREANFLEFCQLKGFLDHRLLRGKGRGNRFRQLYMAGISLKGAESAFSVREQTALRLKDHSYPGNAVLAHQKCERYGESCSASTWEFSSRPIRSLTY